MKSAEIKEVTERSMRENVMCPSCSQIQEGTEFITPGIYECDFCGGSMRVTQSFALARIKEMKETSGLQAKLDNLTSRIERIERELNLK